MTEPPLSVSVVIPCGRPDHIGDCVESVWAAKGARDVEVVVVTPDAEFIPSGLRERVVIVPVDELYAPGRMRNIGVTRATGDVLVFLDDDCRCPEGWIDEMVDALVFRSEVGMVGCRVCAVPPTFWGRTADFALFGAYQTTRSGYQHLGSAAIAIDKKCFVDADGFDESLLASEDWDLSLRVEASGARCWFAADVASIGHHHDRRSFTGIVRNAWRSGFRSGLVVQERHSEQMTGLARAGLWFGRRGLYVFMVIPYASVLSAAMFLTAVRQTFSALGMLPVLFISQCAYHLGVARRLREARG